MAIYSWFTHKNVIFPSFLYVYRRVTPCLVDVSWMLVMAIFHSYVCLPEDNNSDFQESVAPKRLRREMLQEPSLGDQPWRWMDGNNLISWEFWEKK